VSLVVFMSKFPSVQNVAVLSIRTKAFRSQRDLAKASGVDLPVHM
jgi:hypothetical protein